MANSVAGRSDSDGAQRGRSSTGEAGRASGYRQNVVTDNGNVILDVYGMEILDPIALENAINAIPGVVTVGLFANRGADVALIGTPDGVKTIVK